MSFPLPDECGSIVGSVKGTAGGGGVMLVSGQDEELVVLSEEVVGSEDVLLQPGSDELLGSGTKSSCCGVYVGL